MEDEVIELGFASPFGMDIHYYEPDAPASIDPSDAFMPTILPCSQEGYRPFDRVPFEITSLIFLFTFEHQRRLALTNRAYGVAPNLLFGSPAHHVGITLSRVCQAWKALAYDCHFLWTYIRVSYWPGLAPTQFASFYSQDEEMHPAHVVAIIDRVARFTQFCLDHSGSARQLEVYIDAPDYPPEFFDYDGHHRVLAAVFTHNDRIRVCELDSLTSSSHNLPYTGESARVGVMPFPSYSPRFPILRTLVLGWYNRPHDNSHDQVRQYDGFGLPDVFLSPGGVLNLSHLFLRGALEATMLVGVLRHVSGLSLLSISETVFMRHDDEEALEMDDQTTFVRSMTIQPGISTLVPRLRRLDIGFNRPFNGTLLLTMVSSRRAAQSNHFMKLNLAYRRGSISRLCHNRLLAFPGLDVTWIDLEPL